MPIDCIGSRSWGRIVAANQNVVDELIVRLVLDADEYKKADKAVDKQATETERKAKTRDRDRQKRMKESSAAAKQFASSLKSLALTIGSVLGVTGGAVGLIGAVTALVGFETNLRRATVSTGLSNREMQAWGSAARRLGADAQAGAQAIADLAKEQKQFNLTGNAPTMQALARLGIRVSPDTPIQDILSQAQQVYRGATPAQKGQIESGLAASGVSNDLILLIKSEKDVREEFAKSYAESAEENRKALDSVTDALESVKNAGINVANILATILQPNIEQFAKWVGSTASDLSAFTDRVQAAGGGVDGFMQVLNKESPGLATLLRTVADSIRTLGETVDVVVFGLKQGTQGLDAAGAWLDRKFGELTGGPSNQLATAGQSMVNAVGSMWGMLVRDARREGGVPIGAITGDTGGVQLSASSKARVAAGEIGPVPAIGRSATGAQTHGGPRTSAQAIMQYVISKYGLNVQQAAAIAASAFGESEFDPSAFNERGGGRGARGIFQHRGARISAFEKRYGVSQDRATWQQQIDFILTDPYERGLLDRALTGPGGAAAMGSRFSQIFEAHGRGPEDVRRGIIAQQYAQQYNPVTGAQGGSNGNTVNINGPVTVQANNPQEFIGGIQRVSPVQNYNSAVR